MAVGAYDLDVLESDTAAAFPKGDCVINLPKMAGVPPDRKVSNFGELPAPPLVAVFHVSLPVFNLLIDLVFKDLTASVARAILAVDEEPGFRARSLWVAVHFGRFPAIYSAIFADFTAHILRIAPAALTVRGAFKGTQIDITAGVMDSVKIGLRYRPRFYILDLF